MGRLTGGKELIRFTIHEAIDASLWARIPELGIDGWTWCVGGGQMPEDHAKAIQQTGRHVQTYCDAVAYGMIKAEGDVWQRARRVHEHGFELVETNRVVAVAG